MTALQTRSLSRSQEQLFSFRRKLLILLHLPFGRGVVGVQSGDTARSRPATRGRDRRLDHWQSRSKMPPPLRSPFNPSIFGPRKRSAFHFSGPVVILSRSSECSRKKRRLFQQAAPERATLAPSQHQQNHQHRLYPPRPLAIPLATPRPGTATRGITGRERKQAV